MGDITQKEYEVLDLKHKMEFYSVGKQQCNNPTCEEAAKEKNFHSEEPPFNFVYAQSQEGFIKNLSIKHVCATCMTEMIIIEKEYFKKEGEEFSFSTPKTKQHRSKNYYRDYSKQSWKDDPAAGKGHTELSQKDITNFEKRLNNR